MLKFANELLLSFFVGLGVVLGGTIFGALATLFTGRLPLSTMLMLAERLKLWGVIAALGGTFAIIRGIETTLAEGQLAALGKQLLFILSAYAGAHFGYLIILYLTKGE